MKRVVACVGIMVAAWILLIPPSAGPDEPVHVIRSAGLVRGDFYGTPTEIGSSVSAFDVPGWVGTPSPECYWFQPGVSAACINDLPPTQDSSLVFARVAAYPAWGFVLPGIGTLAGSAGLATYLARALGALPAIALVAAAILQARRLGPPAVAGVLLATTPMAWFTFSVVNPSGLAISGGLALWAVLVVDRQPSTETSDREWNSGSGAAWLTAAAMAALALPRRDGLVWLGIIVALSILFLDDSLLARWKWLGRGPQITICGVLVIALTWLMRAGANNRLSALGLAIPLLAVAGKWLWVRLEGFPGWRLVGAVGLGTLSVPATVIGISRFKHGYFDVALFRKILDSTGGNFHEAIGLLGWADTPVPMSAEYLFLIAVGMLASVGLVAGRWMPFITATAIVVASIWASWLMEFAQGGTGGNYWQGRYFLPLLVGIPIVLGAAAARSDRLVQGGLVSLSSVVTTIWFLVVNMAIFSAARRWGVGLDGQLAPWAWDTYSAPVAPVLLLVVHVAASAGLVFMAVGPEGYVQRWLAARKTFDDSSPETL